VVQSRKRKKRKKVSERSINQKFFDEAIRFLLERSLENRISDPEDAKDLYVSARKMGQRGRMHLPRKYHMLFCRSCFTPFNTNTVKIRINSKKRQIHYYCLICHREQCFGYGKKLLRR